MSNALAEMKMKPARPDSTPVAGEWFSEPPVADAHLELPDWYVNFRKESWHTFLETPEPSRTDEAWRFANLKKIRFGRLRLAEPLLNPESIIARSQKRGLKKVSARFVFANNRLVHRDVSGLPEGVICLPISEALAQHGDQVRAHFMREEVRLGGAKFAALHGAASLSGIFVLAPKGVVIEAPIEVDHWAAGEDAAIFPHALLVAERDAAVSVVERFRSVNESDATVAVGVTDLAPEDGGSVQYTSIQRWNDRSRQVQLNGTRVGRDGRAKSCFVNLGGDWVRNESVSRLLGEGGDSRMFSVNFARGTQEFDQRTLQEHEAQHTTSDLLYKNALYGQSRTVFSGLIRVCPGAHYTDAFQSCRNLLGSDEAEANSMPGLEIDADQVRCSHGSTSGQISDEEIFYLQARGIPAVEAKKLISFGFLNEVIDRLDCEELREAVQERLQDNFDRLV